ncbi:MAG: phenylalanine--tRNA ligase subunit beta [Armatimonadota bacterium]
MKVPLSWLRDFVDIDITAEELADSLCSVGILVDKIEYPEKVSNVFAGKIEKIEKHPDADKLRIAQVNAGNETVQIVTGASNVKKGDTVPVALVGAELAGGIKIKKTSLRGVDSFGMMCSVKELGIELKDLSEDQQTGVMILPEGYAPGLDLVSHLNLSDPVFIIEPFANRPDCLSVAGIAHEAACVLGKKMKRKEFNLTETQDICSQIVNIKIQDYKDCPRYIARIIKDVRIKSSDLKMQLRLSSVGIRPVNNIVDITNYVMWETGHPLHAFDLDKLKGRDVIIRRAKKGEELTAIDGSCLKLDENTLVISDNSNAIAVAGVMGGIDSEISESTKNVLLEAALFDPVITRRVSIKLGLPSESAKRFEKGLDYHNVEQASRQAAYMISGEGGNLAKGHSEDASAAPKPVKVSLRPKKLNAVLGSNLKVEEFAGLLSNLGFSIEKQGDKLNIEVPQRRKDIKEEIDLVEEVARLTGYENIGYTLPYGRQACADFAPGLVFENQLREALEKQSLMEVNTYTMLHPDILKKFNLKEEEHLKILNPLSAEQGFVRTSLAPSLVNVIDYNLRNKNEDLKIFEVSHIYKKDSSTRHFAIALCPQPGEKNVDFFELKGICENLLKGFNLEFEYKENKDSKIFHPGINADVYCKGNIIGHFGKLHPQVLENFDITRDIFLAELDLNKIFNLKTDKKYKPFSRYPALDRDLAVVVYDDIKCADIEKIIQASGGGILTQVRCFDEYKGDQIKQNCKSLAFSLRFQAEDRTLKDEEINTSLENIIKGLKEKINAGIRE